MFASATTEKAPADLLRLFGIHQRYHRYVPRHDYLSGPSNLVADALLRDFARGWAELMASLEDHFPPESGWQVWEPSTQFVEAVLVAVLRKRQPPEALLVSPPAAQRQVAGLPIDEIEWPSMPTAKPSSESYGRYCKADDEFVREDLRPSRIPSGLERLKVSYGRLGRRPRFWGPRSR